MNNRNFSVLIIIYAAMVIILTIYSASIITRKNNEISKLKKEQNRLNNLISDYKGQLEEVPSIIESNKEEICK